MVARTLSLLLYIIEKTVGWLTIVSWAILREGPASYLRSHRAVTVVLAMTLWYQAQLKTSIKAKETTISRDFSSQGWTGSKKSLTARWSKSKLVEPMTEVKAQGMGRNCLKRSARGRTQRIWQLLTHPKLIYIRCSPSQVSRCWAMPWLHTRLKFQAHSSNSQTRPSLATPRQWKSGSRRMTMRNCSAL